MFGFFNRKPKPPQFRDLLFGDLPYSQWLGDSATADAEPWQSFARAGSHFEAGRKDAAAGELQRILEMPSLESRQYLQAWHFLRICGVHPLKPTASTVLGVVVEVGLPGGLDIVAAYADGSARYANHAGSVIIWDAPDRSLEESIRTLVDAGTTVASQIGPWLEPRPPAPPTGQARVNMLTPSGLHFGQAAFATLSQDALGGPLIAAATQLMIGLMEKTRT